MPAPIILSWKILGICFPKNIFMGKYHSFYTGNHQISQLLIVFELEHMGSLTKCVPEIRGSVQKKKDYYTLLGLPARGVGFETFRQRQSIFWIICDRFYL